MVNVEDLKFKTQFKNLDHNWQIDESSNITQSKKMISIQQTLESKGSIVIEHWIYCGSQAPKRSVFDDFEEFVEYLTKYARAGDIIDVWSLHQLISSKNRLVTGKCPDEDGRVPQIGAY